MKKITLAKKLVLNKETISEINRVQMNMFVGGADRPGKKTVTTCTGVGCTEATEMTNCTTCHSEYKTACATAYPCGPGEVTTVKG